jgi:hypothetical protein
VCVRMWRRGGVDEVLGCGMRVCGGGVGKGYAVIELERRTGLSTTLPLHAASRIHVAPLALVPVSRLTTASVTPRVAEKMLRWGKVR